MLKKSSLPWSLKQLKSMNDNGKLNFDIAIQRKGKIWDVHRKSLLINSLLEGYPVPNIFTKFDGEVYYFIDGKQRLTSLFEFLEDGFALSPKTPAVDGEEIKGLKFSELSAEFQKVILQTTFSITKFDNITNEQIEQLFFRLNNGMPLKTIESTRVLLGMDNLKLVESITNHDFFVEKASISKTRYTEQETVLQLLMFLKNPNTGFSSKEVRNYVEDYNKSDIEQELVDSLIDKLDYLNEAFTKKQKFLKKIHLPMILSIVDTAKTKEITPEYFGLWATEFYTDLDKESLYYLASQSGSAKKENVQIRLKYINEEFSKFFDIYEKEQEPEPVEV